MEGTLKRIYESIINGEQSEAVKYVQQALAEGINPVDILNEGMVKAWQRLGGCSRKGNIRAGDVDCSAGNAKRLRVSDHKASTGQGERKIEWERVVVGTR